MIDTIRQIVFQMLVLAEYKGDKNLFIAEFLHKCQKNLSPAYTTYNDYYAELYKAAHKSVNEFIESNSSGLSASQIRNLRLLANSFSSIL